MRWSTVTAAEDSLPATIDLDAYHGDTWSQTFRLLEGSTPYDLTGATVTASARNQAGATTALTVTTAGLDPGEVAISGTLAIGAYDYDIQVVDTNGTNTWIRGELTVHGDVTP